MVGLSLSEINTVLAGQLQGEATKQITGVKTLVDAGACDIAFLANHKYIAQLETCRAGAVILHPEHAHAFSGNKIVLSNPYLGYAKVSALFANNLTTQGIASSAVIDPTATLGASVSIAHGAIIGARSVIEDNVTVGANTVIGPDSVVGESSCLAANVSVYGAVTIGKRAIIHSGAVLGADGFGFAKEGDRYTKIYQLGGVIIGDDVEIGACTTIDRGALSDTKLGNGVKLDNHIQIAHNVELGDNTALAGCVGIAGSTIVGKNCTLAAACVVLGHLTIADNTLITAGALVTRSITSPGAYSSGTGLDELSSWRKNAVRFKQLDKMAKQISRLERQITALSKEDK